MPIYEYLCQRDGRFELLLPISEADNPKQMCAKCGAYSERMASLTTMRPDTLWSGVMTDQGYVTSQSTLSTIEKQKGIITLDGRADVEAMKKRASDARKNWDVKLGHDTEQVFKENFAGTGLVDSFGEFTPCANDTWRNDRIHHDKTNLTT